MDLSTTPFTKKELDKVQGLLEFNELGLTIRMIKGFIKPKKNSGNEYMFGALINKCEYVWFFNKKPVATGRAKMREIYSALLIKFKDTPEVLPFVSKYTRD